ncbi:uncharacterized protein NPIL_508881 [Nephila pilipes]|uniref:Uncharacterized protein n=1 Tax=Nephila pilipes TaxID=299642 RepID=A0A8X6IJJ4_NEPPI|nr:uncharacterized protein NPIL_508881 [Nephila pilipes]
MCVLVRDIFKHLLYRLNRELNIDDLSEDFKDLVFTYRDIVKCLSNMDEDWSPLTFLAFLTSMIGLFWGCYLLAFRSIKIPELFTSLLSFTIVCLCANILILVSASTTNELSCKTKNLLRRLSYRITGRHQGIKRHLKEYLSQEHRLTLWNIYIIDMSLMFASFGTLLTYGILLGSLKNSS